MVHPYIPMTDTDKAAMLGRIGVSGIEELFADIPPDLLNPSLNLPPAASEAELMREILRLAGKNTPIDTVLSFLGAGAYQHFVPSIVDHIIRRGEFLTAYTPYQPEISQGTLQAGFEFQTMVCELFGMEVANAGMYDGASALAEACLMAAAHTDRREIILADTVHPDAIDTVRTYADGRNLEVRVIPFGQIHPTEAVACIVVQRPNFLGYLEDLQNLEAQIHASGALFIISAEPVSLGILKTPGELGADIAVGDGQPLVSLSFGGPSVGLFACRQSLVRSMPGRVIGRTTDVDGQTGYVLTLQTREQHIRRERATSNICTSTQLVALAFTVSVVTLGKQGFVQLAEACYHKAHYAAEAIARLPGFGVDLRANFFQEFVAGCPFAPAEINRRLLERGIIGGYDVSDQRINGLLVCVSDLHRRDDIDVFVRALKEVSDDKS